jgi:predicted CopG family antitoxin
MSDASYVWLDEVWVDRLGAMRRRGESVSDVIVRLTAAPR